MATILVADDRPTNRQFLVTLLGYVGHRVVEAADGIEALEVARAERPQLIIADVVMPRMDGVEFVRELRNDPSFDAVILMFYTASHRIAEVRPIANEVGVPYLLQKPASPEEILELVSRALGEDSVMAPVVARPTEGAAERRVPQVVLDQENRIIRMAAIIELALDITAEGDPREMVKVASRAARGIANATYAGIGILNDDGQSLRYFGSDALEGNAATTLPPPAPREGVLAQVLDRGHALRLKNTDRRRQSFGCRGIRPLVPSWRHRFLCRTRRSDGCT